MTTPQPDYRGLTGHQPDHDAAMDTFTVRLPRWRLVRLIGRNPLIRVSDRIEAVVLVLAVALSLLAVPVAAAVGTAVHDTRQRVYAEQAQDRQMITGTVVDDSPTQVWRSKTMAVRARWFAAGAEHTGAVKTRQPVKSGDSIDIWVDQNGFQVAPPTRTAVDEAVAAALATWLGVAGAAAALFVGTRAALDRSRHARWQHDFDNLVSDGKSGR
jgi:hypothetical protein